MAKYYDYECAKRMIQMKSDFLVSAEMGMKEDWFWTAQPVFEGGQFLADLDVQPEIAGIQSSSWATPTILLTYKDGREEFVDCFYGDSESKRPDWFDLGVLSGQCQEWVESVTRPKLGLDG